MKTRKRTRARQRKFFQQEYSVLEQRNLLAGTFSFDASVLKMDMTTEATSIVISQTADKYQFRLTEGTWTGVEANGATGNGSAILAVERTVLDAAELGLEISDDNNVDGTIFFAGATDFSAMASSLRLLGHGRVAQAASSKLMIPELHLDSKFVDLTSSANEIDRVFANFVEFLWVDTIGDVHYPEFYTQYARLNSTGNLSILSEDLIARQLIAKSVGDLHLASSRLFDVGQLDVSGANIGVIASTHYIEDEIDFVSKIDQLSFNSMGSVYVHSSQFVREGGSSRTQLIGENTANNLVLDFEGSLVMEQSTSLTVAADARFEAVGNFWMAHFDENSLIIGGDATFRVRGTSYFGVASLSRLSIGEAGFVSFGSLNLQGGTSYVLIHEDNSMVLQNFDFEGQKWARLVSGDSIVDVEGTQFVSDGIVEIHAEAFLAIGEHESDVVDVAAIRIKAKDVYVGGAGSTQFGSLQFEATGVAIIEEDDSTYLVGDSSAESIRLVSRQTISNGPRASIASTGQLTMHAFDRIYLANRIGESLTVGGLAQLSSGISTIVGRGGIANFGQLNVLSGFVNINESSRTHLVGNIVAAYLNLESTSFITAGDFTTIRVDGETHFSTPAGLLIGRSENNVFEFCSHVNFSTSRFAVIESSANVTIASHSVLAGAVEEISIDSIAC